MRIIYLILCLSFIQCGTRQNHVQTLPLKQVVDIINQSLDNTNTDLTKTNHYITSAKISLKTIYDVSAGGSFKLFVKASHSEDIANASKFVFQYDREKNEELVGDSCSEDMGAKLFENELTNAIKSAVDQWHETHVTINGLSKKSFSVEIAFTVKTDTKGGVEFKICGAGIGADVDCGKTAIHTISLTFS